MPNDIQKIADMMDDDGDEFTDEPPDTIEGTLKQGWYGETLLFKYYITPMSFDWPVDKWAAQVQLPSGWVYKGDDGLEQVEHEGVEEWETPEKALEAIEGHISEMMYTPEDDNYENRQMGLTALD